MPAGLALAGLALAGCGQPGTAGGTTAPPAATSPAAASPAGPAAADPATVAALLRVAQAFNDAYDNGDFGAAYDRWDARSQAIISRAEYIRRHLVCAPATRSAARVTGAVRGPAGTWLVSYQIGGSRLTDTWYYARRRWVFDIVRSNPGAARLYRLPFARYAAATGCSAH
jgi:hypothetical protein